MAIFFISLRLLVPFPKIELAMVFSDNGLVVAFGTFFSGTQTRQQGNLTQHHHVSCNTAHFLTRKWDAAAHQTGFCRINSQLLHAGLSKSWG
jgi:hypothetical protein